MNSMKNRNVLNDIKQYLNSSEVIVIHGARQVGKTTLLKLLEKHILIFLTIMLMKKIIQNFTSTECL